MCLHPVLGRAIPVLVVAFAGALLAQDAPQSSSTTPSTPAPAVPAEQQAPAPSATGTTPAATPAASTPAPAAAVTQGSPMASVIAASASLRVWPTANSPVYEGSLNKDAVVRVGRSDAGFREVLLPIGPIGYVHKNFANEPTAEGKVAIKTKSVAFRYRPKSGEAPVSTLVEGTELWVVGEQDDWWKVRNAGSSCWVLETEIQVFDNPPDTMTLAHAEFEKTQKGEVGARIESIAKAAEALKIRAERREKLAAIQTDFSKELKKSPREQKFEGIAAATDELLAQVQGDAELKPMAEELKRRVGAQQWVVEATAARDAQPKPVEGVRDVPPVIVPDALDRFQAVGFLRWTKGFTGPGRYVVEKGGKQLFEVTCQSGRYDLSLFVDCEVGLIGASRRPNFESLRVLDVEKVEVLAPRQ
jgi:hypothetical protein